MNKKILLFLGILFACLIFTQKSQGALGNVVLLSPANGAVINSFDIELSWKSVDGAKSYKYQTMSNNAVIESGITTSTTIKLDKNKAYFDKSNIGWKIFPCNDAEGNNCSSSGYLNYFIPKPRMSDYLLFPKGGTRIINPPMVITAKKIQGAGSYKYEIIYNSQNIATNIANISGSQKYVIDKGDYFLWYIENEKLDWVGGKTYGINFYACVDSKAENCPSNFSIKTFFYISPLTFDKKKDNSVGTFFSKLKSETLLPCKKSNSDFYKRMYNCSNPYNPNFALTANFVLSLTYNLTLIDKATSQMYGDMATIGIDDEIKIDLERPEGEWFLAGGFWDSPPIAWIDDAVKDFIDFKDISDLYEYEYNTSYNIIKPKFGIAATDPLINKKVSVVAQESDRVAISYDQNGNPIIKALKPGIVHLTAKIPEMPTYQTIDNIWFDNGFIPEYSQNFTIIIDANKKPKIVIGNFKAPPQVLDLKVDNVDYCAFDPSIRFNWKFSDPDSINGDTQSNYQIQVSQDPSFSNLIIDKKVSGSSQSYLGKFSDGFEYGKTYYWRMKLWDSQTPDQNESQWVIAENNLTTPDKPYPAVDFDFREELIDKKATFIFENKTETRGEDITYRWEFGDGQISNAENPSHVYALPDNYDVTLYARTKFGTECKKIKPLAPEGDLEFQDSPVDLLNF